jgi:carbon monoxide dehydrogenase subunit G
MEITGHYTLDAPAEVVWNTLMDPTIVAACLPGCRQLTPIGEDSFEAIMSVTVSAITGSYTGTVAIEDKQAPRSYRLVVDGSGRTGFVKGHATITLREEGPRTLIAVDSDVHVGGAIARVGQRLLSGVGKMTMDRFFGCVRQKVRVPG